MERSTHPGFEDCLEVREVLQAYAPIVGGLPVHEGEAAMGRIEKRLEAVERWASGWEHSAQAWIARDLRRALNG